MNLVYWVIEFEVLNYLGGLRLLHFVALSRHSVIRAGRSIFTHRHEGVRIADDSFDVGARRTDDCAYSVVRDAYVTRFALTYGRWQFHQRTSGDIGARIRHRRCIVGWSRCLATDKTVIIAHYNLFN